MNKRNLLGWVLPLTIACGFATAAVYKVVGRAVARHDALYAGIDN
jgi:hypothetical protein